MSMILLFIGGAKLYTAGISCCHFWFLQLSYRFMECSLLLLLLLFITLQCTCTMSYGKSVFTYAVLKVYW